MTTKERVNPLKLDPSRTTMLRQKWMTDFNRRYNTLAARLRELVDKEDSFGLTANMSACGAGELGSPGFQPGNTCGKGNLSPGIPLAGETIARVTRYKNTGYKHLNEQLRRGTHEQNRYLVEDVKYLDHAIQSQHFQEPGLVYRAYTGKRIAKKLEIGKTITDPAYLSTSSSISGTLRAVSDTGNDHLQLTVVEIKVPAGTNAVNVDKIASFHHMVHPQLPEGEILFGRGTSIKITGEREEGGLLIREAELISNVVNNARWQFLTSEQQLDAFKSWLAHQIGETIRGDSDKWLEQYVEAGYRKGLERAFTDVRKRKNHKLDEKLDFYEGTKEQFLRDSFSRPVSVDRVKLLASRVYNDLDGVNDQMSATLSRTLVDGMIRGDSPRIVADELTRQVGITKNKALTIARTETLRAHNEGALDAMEDLGVTDVGVAVEWDTAEDGRVCPLCRPLDGIILTIKEARGMFPRHPNCFASPNIPIKTIHGWKRIADIVIGDLVLTHRDRYCKVKDTYHTHWDNRKVLRFLISHQLSNAVVVFDITHEHPIWVLAKNGSNFGWMSAKDVVMGDRFKIVEDNSLGAVHGIVEVDMGPGMLYNFSVEEDESYIASGIAVSNCRCVPIPANVGEPTQGQKRTKERITAAIKQSLAIERGKPSKEKKVLWGGVYKTIGKKRPKSLVGVVNVENMSNCGAGAPGSPGFQPGNTCGADGMGAAKMKQREAIKKYKKNLAANRKKMRDADLETVKKYTNDGIKKNHKRDELNGLDRPSIYNWLKEREKSTFTMKHGMSNPEKVNVVKIDGVFLVYSSGTFDATTETFDEKYADTVRDNVAGFLHSVVGGEYKPSDNVWKSNNEIIFTQQSNKADAYWAKTYQMEDFQSVATGGDGKICVYRSHRGGMGMKTFYHETGHNIARRRWGTTDPPDTSFFVRAAKQERPTTDYAKQALEATGKYSEDFAESVAYYYTSLMFKWDFPKKHAALEKVL